MISLTARICLVLLSGSIYSQEVYAQSVPNLLERIGEMIIAEDASALTQWASNPVDIAVFGASRSYSVAQATYVLRNFFESVEVESFSVRHFTESEGGLFVEGTIDGPESEQSLRVYIRLKESVDGWILRELIFERDPARDQ